MQTQLTDVFIYERLLLINRLMQCEVRKRGGRRPGGSLGSLWILFGGPHPGVWVSERKG